MKIGISPVLQFSYIVSELERTAQNVKRLAYVEPHFDGNFDIVPVEMNDVIENFWKGVIVEADGLN